MYYLPCVYRSLICSARRLGKEKQLSTAQGDSLNGQSQHNHQYHGHTHFWERATMSRRQFIKTSVGVTGVVLGSGLLLPSLALASGADPKPIPIGIQPFGPGTQLFHVILPAPGIEPSTITDFHGSIGLAHVQGTGIGTNTDTGHQRHLLFDVDARFMQGVYIGMDGHQHTGTFGLI